MEAQLEFAWQPERATWKPREITYEEPIYYELPDQLDFKLAELPVIVSELPAPMAFSNAAGKKLVQFTGLPSKPQGKKNEKAHKKAIPEKKIAKVPQEVREKPTWNNQVSTIGLFDAAISKKIPLDIKHAINKDPGFNLKKPAVFYDFEEIPAKNKPKTGGKNELVGKKEKIAENLEIKFIADQEELVRKLEKQLESEKMARKKLDMQFSEKLKDLETMDKKVKSLQNPLNNQVKKPLENVLVAKTTEKRSEAIISKPISKQFVVTPTVIHRSSSSSGVRHDNKGGNMNELPTHDLSPMVLKANKPLPKGPPSTKPHISSSKSFSNKPITKVPEKPAAFSSFPEKTLTKSPQAYIPPKVKFESHDIIQSDPILNSLSAAITKFKTTEKYSDHTGIGLISKVSSKYIAYYANELSDMLIDDFLKDCVNDLEKIEERKQRVIHKEFQKVAGENFEKLVEDFHAETVKIQGKYAKSNQKVKNFKLDEEDDIGILIESKKVDWEIYLDDRVLEEIRKYRKKFEEFQKVFAGGSDGKLWDVYSRIGDDILDEVIRGVAEDYDLALEEFTERMISQEFS